MRRLHSPKFVKVIRRSEFFLAFGLLVAWWCFYEVMRECDLTHPPLLSQTMPAQRIMPAPDERVKSSTDEPADIMERPATINVPQMSLFSLAKILSASGLKLDYQAKDKDMKLDCPEQGDKVLAEILVDLLRPHGLGFYRQGDTIHLVKMTLTTEKKVRDQESAPYQSNLLRTTIKAKEGEPIDMWVDSTPLLRLRIIAQPLYGESKPDQVGTIVEGNRNQQLWFHNDFETRFGQPSQIEVRGTDLMWCRLKPTGRQGSDITLEMEFYYEASLPTS